MKCEKWRIMLSVAADSELDGPDSTALAGHVAGCRDCRAFAGSLRAVRAELSKDSGPLAPPEFFETRLAGRIASKKSRRSAFPFRLTLLKVRDFTDRFAYASAAVAAIAIFIYVASPVIRTFRDVAVPASDISSEFYTAAPSLAALSSPEEDETFDSAIIDIYYGAAMADSYPSSPLDGNNNVSRFKREQEVV